MVSTPDLHPARPLLRSLAAIAVVGVMAGTIGSAVGSVHTVTRHRATTETRTPVISTTPAPDLAGTGAVVHLNESAIEAVDPFEAIGVWWAGLSASGEVRYRSDGTWSDWTPVDIEGADDPATPAKVTHAARVVSEMSWVGQADAYQVRVPAGATDVHVQLVRDVTDTETVVGPRPADAAAVEPSGPGIHSRAEWNARDATTSPSYGTKVRVVFVHHTVNSNDYAPSDVPAIIRAIQAYHMDANGWTDIGYNFLVDRFGGIWEGRGGGVDLPVIGAHTGGFNTDTSGVAVIGDFRSTWPTEPSVNAVAQITGWKLTLGSQDPFGTTVLTSRNNPDNTKYPPGTQGTFNNVSGHRDAWYTECPGDYLYARLGDIRTRAAAWYPNVMGSIDGSERAPGGVLAMGWAVDVNTSDPIYAHAYLDGSFGGYGLASGSRPDVGGAFPAYGSNHGYSINVPAAPGSHQICTYGINDVTGGPNLGLGCISVFVDPQPTGSLDLVRRAPGGVLVGGWALDPDTAQLIPVHVYSAGAFRSAVATGGSRPDVGAAWPAYGSSRGYDTVVGMPGGFQQVCAYAINVGPGSNQGIGCRSVNVTFDPFGSLDLASGGSGTVAVGGWGIDPDTSSWIAVHVYIDGNFAAATAAVGNRPDVGAAYPDYGSAHGFQLAVPVGAGSHLVCVYGINSGAGQNGVIGCRTVQVS